MDSIQKLKERIFALKNAIEATQHAATVDRKFGDKATSGHYTKAITELTHEMSHLTSLLERAERQSS